MSTRSSRAAAPTRHTTLADVARAAGVVPMTASRAINNTGYVSDDVRERVLKAASELNYRPNMLARSLKGQTLKAIGIMLPDIANPFSAELVAGIQKELTGNGYSAFLATAHRSVELETAALDAFVDHRVAGVIVATRGTALGDDAIAEIVRSGVPVVTVGRPVEGAKVDCVTADHRKGAYEAVNHLLKLGHRRIGFMGIAPEHASNLRRFQGYKDALEEHGIELRNELIVGPESSPAYATEEDGYAAMMKIGALTRRPTAILARNDYTAMGALHAAQELGIRVPSEISMVSFDNTPISAHTTPPLTTVAQPISEQGSRAARFLLDRIEGRFKGGGRMVSLECQLVVRKSTARIAKKGRP
ncbi:MAG TPA: LacI family DNA-binding transcriptional regulator [Clostridia bacterium]|nr:LacI family DNA-binding transcriptional regulator [Clostridia bacterium]